MAVNGRKTFLSHFVLVLACAGASFFAWQRGVFQTIYANDASCMTSAIAALFVVTAVWLGWQAWLVDDIVAKFGASPYRHLIVGSKLPADNADFGHSAERWSVMLGLLGTTIGLSLQAHALTSGPSSFGALATSLYTTGTGITSALLIGVMVFSLEAGIRRARK
jgi:hypothetical protein